MCSSRVYRFKRLNLSQVLPSNLTVANQASPDPTISAATRVWSSSLPPQRGDGNDIRCQEPLLALDDHAELNKRDM
jgi:hypothetical protein